MLPLFIHNSIFCIVFFSAVIFMRIGKKELSVWMIIYPLFRSFFSLVLLFIATDSNQQKRAVII